MKVWKENIENWPAVIIQHDAELGPAGFIEVTDIVGISTYGMQGVNESTPGWRDQKNVRDKLKVLVYTKMGIDDPADVDDPAKWNLLTADEKSIAVHWFLIGKHDFQNEVVNDRKYWTVQAANYRKWTMTVKEGRLDLMESLVFNGIKSVADAKQVLSDLDQIPKGLEEFIFDNNNKLTKKVRVRRMARLYINGIQSQEEDGIAGLYDYINSTIGTPFAGNGLRSITYPLRGAYTADSLADELLSVIHGTW